MSKLPDEYEVLPLVGIPVEYEDALVHTDEQPYCGQGNCPCVVQAVIDGLLTVDEAVRIELGEQL